MFNVFNNQKLVNWDTRIAADEASSRDGLGLPTSYIKGPQFGRAIGAASYPTPFNGTTGGRVILAAVSLRF